MAIRQRVWALICGAVLILAVAVSASMVNAKSSTPKGNDGGASSRLDVSKLSKPATMALTSGQELVDAPEDVEADSQIVEDGWGSGATTGK